MHLAAGVVVVSDRLRHEVLGLRDGLLGELRGPASGASALPSPQAPCRLARVDRSVQPPPLQTWGQTCSETQMAKNSIDPQRVRTCVTASNASFAPPIFLNHLLEEELILRENMLVTVRTCCLPTPSSSAAVLLPPVPAPVCVQSLPTMVVNDVILRGNALPSVLLQAICGAYPKEPKPRLCTDCINAGPSQVDACMNPAPAPSASTAMPGWAVGLIIFVVVAIVWGGGGLWWFFRRQKAEVKEMLDDYRTLRECGVRCTNEGQRIRALHRLPAARVLQWRPAKLKAQWAASLRKRLLALLRASARLQAAC